MNTEHISLIKIEASEGMALTNGETYARILYLGRYDKPDNWHEIPIEEVPDDVLESLF